VQVFFMVTVHDLAGPLTAMGAVQLLPSKPHSFAWTKELCHMKARRREGMIGIIAKAVQPMPEDRDVEVDDKGGW